MRRAPLMWRACVACELSGVRGRDFQGALHEKCGRPWLVQRKPLLTLSSQTTGEVETMDTEA